MMIDGALLMMEVKVSEKKEISVVITENRARLAVIYFAADEITNPFDGAPKKLMTRKRNDRVSAFTYVST